jgi:hypothetical protein
MNLLLSYIAEGDGWTASPACADIVRDFCNEQIIFHHSYTNKEAYTVS